MKKTIWYMYKPGDVRDYAMTTPPSPEWAEAMRVQGFKLFQCLVDIPQDEIAVEGYVGEAAPAREVPMHAVRRCCGTSSGEPHRHDCFSVLK